MSDEKTASDLVWARVRDAGPREIPPEVAVGRDHEIMEYYRKVEKTLTDREVLTVRVDVLTNLWDAAWRHGIDTRNQEIAPLEEDNERLSRTIRSLQEEVADQRQENADQRLMIDDLKKQLRRHGHGVKALPKPKRPKVPKPDLGGYGVEEEDDGL